MSKDTELDDKELSELFENAIPAPPLRKKERKERSDKVRSVKHIHHYTPKLAVIPHNNDFAFGVSLLREMSLAKFEEVYNILWGIISDPLVAPSDRLKGICIWLERGAGKPVHKIEIGDDKKVVDIKHLPTAVLKRQIEDIGIIIDALKEEHKDGA